MALFAITVFVPSRGFLFFYEAEKGTNEYEALVFVPSRGFLFFYDETATERNTPGVFVPSRGFLFFYAINSTNRIFIPCFRPLTGISLFLSSAFQAVATLLWFSSPHGDFSFSILEQLEQRIRKGFRPLTGISLFL